MGQQVSVETFASTSDADGHQYWTSFDPYPFKIGSRKLSYMGIFNGSGPLAGQKCVVKTVRDGAIKPEDWLLESKGAKVAKTFANHFNKTRQNDELKVTFNTPIMAEIDTMSDCLCINDILGKPKKKWQNSEPVSIELYLKGKFEDYEYGWVSSSELLVPEAFSHFSWCRSEGSLLVSNLQGVKTSKAYHFTGPVVHSEMKEFGSSDQGHEGIKNFFKLHTCNHICKGWPRLGDGVNLSGWGEYMHNSVFVDRRPSAPFPPPYENYDPPSYSAVDDLNRNTVHECTRSRDSTVLIPSDRQHPPVSQRETGMHSRLCTTSTHEQRIGPGFVIDWRQEFMNLTFPYGQQLGHDNPAFENVFEMQLLWFVKQMSYAFYPSLTPPPPYCRCTSRSEQERQLVQRHNPVNENNNWIDGDDDDTKNLLPPEYTEQSVDPDLDFVTYL